MDVWPYPYPHSSRKSEFDCCQGYDCWMSAEKQTHKIGNIQRFRNAYHRRNQNKEINELFNQICDNFEALKRKSNDVDYKFHELKIKKEDIDNETVVMYQSYKRFKCFWTNNNQKQFADIDNIIQESKIKKEEIDFQKVVMQQHYKLLELLRIRNGQSDNIQRELQELKKEKKIIDKQIVLLYQSYKRLKTFWTKNGKKK